MATSSNRSASIRRIPMRRGTTAASTSRTFSARRWSLRRPGPSPSRAPCPHPAKASRSPRPTATPSHSRTSVRCSSARVPPSRRAIRWRRSDRVAIPRQRCRMSISASGSRPMSRDTSIRSGSCPRDPRPRLFRRRLPRRPRSHRPSLRRRRPTSRGQALPHRRALHLPPPLTAIRSGPPPRRRRPRRLRPPRLSSRPVRCPGPPGRSCRPGRGLRRQQHPSLRLTRRGRCTPVSRRPRPTERRSRSPRRARGRFTPTLSPPRVAPARCRERPRRLLGPRGRGLPRRSRPAAAVSIAAVTARGSRGRPVGSRRSRRMRAVQRPRCCGAGDCRQARCRRRLAGRRSALPIA